MKRALKTVSAVLTVSVFIAGCGYSLSGSKVALPEGVESIAVTPFENRTHEPDVGIALAEAMQREILKRKMVKLRPVGKADAELTGVIEEIHMESLAYDENGFTVAYGIRVVVSAKLVRGSETLWRADRVVVGEEIAVEGVVIDNAVRRARALDAISEDIAERIHLMMVEGW